jgi:hypothetical protein
MLYRLKRHPWSIEARFEHCLVLTFAFPREKLAPLLAPGLELEEHEGLGFLAAALVQTRDLRPAGWPRRLGQDFILSGYRIFSRFRTRSGMRLRGLRILRSDADRWRMVVGGNLLTHYNYHRCRATLERREGRLRVCVRSSDGRADLNVTADLSAQPAALPSGSPFRDEAESRRFAGPLPWTFDYECETNSLILIKGVRRNWSPRLVPVMSHDVGFLRDPMFRSAEPILASAFYVGGIDYRWERGIVEPLTGHTNLPRIGAA